MKFNVHIKNIGKLTDAKLEFGQFTVLAGPNNTGKSFVSKLMYSIFDAMNANHADVYFKNLMKPVTETRTFGKMMRFLSMNELEDEEVNSIFGHIAKIEDAFKNFTADNVGKIKEITQKIIREIETVRNAIDGIRKCPRNLERTLLISADDFKKYWEELDEKLGNLQKILEEVNASDLLAQGMQSKIASNLIQNFQVPNLVDLLGNKDQIAKVDIDNLGMLEIENNRFRIDMSHAGLMELQAYSRVAYLESPVYWKLKNALEDVRLGGWNWLSARKRITGIPEYFYDLARSLRLDQTGEMAFSDVYENLTGDKVMGGKITIADDGNLLFVENGRKFPLSTTAMGTTNLGVLALLIERKVLDETSILFIDEPEAHLHPEWQVTMAKALFALAEKGVHVVIATHSPDILKWLEVHAKKNPDAKELIALNKFPINNEDADGQDFDDKMAAIKRELTKPFADLYTAGL